MRFIKELQNPSLKCERIGHKDIQRKRRIRIAESGYYVAADHRANITICGRCKRRLDPEIIERIVGYTSVSMPSRMWDEMREYGYLIL